MEKDKKVEESIGKGENEAWLSAQEVKKFDAVWRKNITETNL